MFQRILFILCMFPMLAIGQQSIKGIFSPVEEFDWILVYKVSPTHSDYVGDAKIDDKGNFEFELDSTQSKGMYRLVYAVPQEEYNFDLIYNAEEDIEFTFNMETGLEYQASSENKLMSSYTNSMAMVSQSIGNFYRQKSTDTTALMAIYKTQKETQEEFEKISEGTIASSFIKANRPYIPEQFEDMSTYITNLKEHFFDNVDFNNEVLQSSNFLVERCLNYVFGMMSPDASDMEIFKNNIEDVAVAMTEATTETKKMLLHIVWQQFAEANYEEVANFIADSYLIPLAQSLNEEELILELTNYKNLSFGKQAPDFEIALMENDKSLKKKLSTLDIADTYIVVFWSSSCSHCLEELPQLQEYLSAKEFESTKVVAFGLEEDELRWKSETYNYPDFIHVIGLGKWDNPVGNAYDISATPSYFILDRDKRIVGKPLDLEALKKYFSDQK